VRFLAKNTAEKDTFLQYFLSKPQAWHIISPCGAGYHHGNAVYLITRRRASCLRLDDIQHFVLMIYRNKLRMIYKACVLICLRRSEFHLYKAEKLCYNASVL